MNSRRLPKISLALSIVAMVVGAIGFMVLPMLNAFVMDKFDAYGDVPIPGSASLHLPAGKLSVSFHTEVISGPRGGGLPVPKLGIDIEPPPGVPDPTVTESYGSTTTINNDSHRRVWFVQVPADGMYKITTEGQINGFISPSLAFGRESSYGWSVWPFVGLFAIGLPGLIGSMLWLARARRVIRPFASAEQAIPLYAPTDEEVSAGEPEHSLASHAPTGEAVKLQQLKTLASLRESGALTEAEFETEKRRILEGR
ncbi:MAG: SHOCT domain-containing protein [Mycobacterium sp.]|nr:SHOCT domain-containing protein [Mycobacterium sp.]